MNGMQVIIVGAGGHGQVVAEILWRMHAAGHEIAPVGYLDEDEGMWGQKRAGLPVIGKIADLAAIPHDGVIVGIGNNHVRRHLFQQLQARHEQLVVACHPTAVLARDITIGPGTLICANVVVNPGSIIGANVILNTACTVDHHTHIGDHVHIAPGVHLGGDVQVGEGSLVGIGAVVIPQKRVGKWCTVGAAAAVHRDLPDEVTAVGVPARILDNQ